MTTRPTTRYATSSDGYKIAYQVAGTGEIDIVLSPILSCIDVMWEDASFAHALERFTRMGRLITFDSRGFGASDPVGLGSTPTAEAWMEDLKAVLDIVGSSQAVIVANGAPFIALLFAATYPERTRALVFINSFVRWLEADDYATGRSEDVLERNVLSIRETWGTGTAVSHWAPSRADDADFRDWHARFERLSASPTTYSSLSRWALSLDQRDLLQSVHVPTLVIHRSTQRQIDDGRYLENHIKNAQRVGLPGGDSHFFTQDSDLLLDEIETFVTGARPADEPDRFFATVLFTDIVRSTEHQASVGDTRWKEVLDRHDDILVHELKRFRGEHVKTTGDGVLAVFDGPTRAIRCAVEMLRGLKKIGLEARAGLHTGEIERRSGDVTGIAVTIGKRIADLASPEEVIVSSTVRDLVAGSGIAFKEHGVFPLKGVPEQWTLYAVASSPDPAVRT
jgi:class 3 adenylate cyclase/pimeloyl-ACP methyl ester carboxylesterase